MSDIASAKSRRAPGRQILFVTGTRADFGKLEPLAIAARESGFRVGFFVTGMHMMERYGLTKTEVHRTPGVSVAEFINQREGDPQDVVLAKTVIGFSDYLQEARPDLVVIHGDRVEALACSLVCATNYIRCAHIEGGEVSGTIDEIFRHCNTKLSSVHLVSSETARRRVLRLGERAETVHVIGSPELDQHHRPSGVPLERVLQRYAIPFNDYGVCVFHPVTSEGATMRTQAEDLFSALRASERAFVVILPNNDPGSNDIQAAIQSLPPEQFRIIPSMRFNYFSELLKNAGAIVGNSSTGIREAPFIGIPTLDIGTRQSNRAEAASVVQCEARDAEAIAAFLKHEWGKRYPCHDGFGVGTAAATFTALLQDEQFWSNSLQKQFNDESPELRRT